MEHPRPALVTIAAAALASTALASLAGAATPAFTGDVCALVTPAAVQAAGIAAPCVQAKTGTAQSTLAKTYSASWGTSATGSDHFMSLQVGPIKSGNLLRPSRLLPRGPGKLLGPVVIAPGIKAYYTQAAYKGAAGGRGTMRFVDKSHLLQITIVNASGRTLSGLEAVARAAAANI
ncbi:MAG: hypothetical protein ACXVRV_14720 [Gaiellaceae bacterium]